MTFHRQPGTKPLETSQVMHNLGCKLEVFLTETNSTPLSPFTMLVHPVTKSFWLKTTLYGGRGGSMGKNGVLTIFIESLKGFGPVVGPFHKGVARPSLIITSLSNFKRRRKNIKGRILVLNCFSCVYRVLFHKETCLASSSK